MAGKIMIQMEDGSLMEVSPNDPMSFDEESGTLSKKKGLSDLAKQYGVEYGKDYAIKEGATALESAFATPEIVQAGDVVGTSMSGAPMTAGMSSAGSTVSQAPLMSPGLASIAGPAALAAIAAGTVYEGYKGYKNSEGGLKGGYEAWKDSNPLVKYNPVLAGAPFIGGLFGTKSRTKQEEDNRKMLAEKGIVIPNADVKEWENNPTFAKSRQEKDLTGKDIVNAAQFYMNVPGYEKFDAAKKEAIANEALKQGLIRERRGQVELSLNDQFQKFIAGQQAPAATASSQQRAPSRSEPQKKAEKKAKLEQIIPELKAPTALAPRYDINLSEIYRNPYL